MRGPVASATIFKLMSDIWMLSLLPTPFWDTNTQMTVAGIEPAGLAVKRTFGKSFKETQTTCQPVLTV